MPDKQQVVCICCRALKRSVSPKDSSQCGDTRRSFVMTYSERHNLHVAAIPSVVLAASMAETT